MSIASLPKELLSYIFAYTEIYTHWRAISLVCHRFRNLIFDQLPQKTESILTRAKGNPSYLCRLIDKEFPSVRISSIPKCVFVFEKIFQVAQSSGVSCLQEFFPVSQFNRLDTDVEAAQDRALQSTWPRLRHAIAKKKPSLVKSINADANALKIRNWLEESLPSLGNITSLLLPDLQLTILPAPIFQLTSLETLSLKNNKISQLPKEIGHLLALKNLIVRDNCLEELPQAMCLLNKLVSFDGSRNQFKGFPPILCTISKLQTVCLAKNKLTCLPEEIQNLQELHEICLTSNELKEFPEAITKITSLRRIFISFNQISFLPKTIDRLTKLNCLEISNNKLTFLPETILLLYQATSFQFHMDASGNQITDIPHAFLRFYHFGSLSLENNPCASLQFSIYI